MTQYPDYKYRPRKKKPTKRHLTTNTSATNASYTATNAHPPTAPTITTTAAATAFTHSAVVHIKSFDDDASFLQRTETVCEQSNQNNETAQLANHSGRLDLRNQLIAALLNTPEPSPRNSPTFGGHGIYRESPVSKRHQESLFDCLSDSEDAVFTCLPTPERSPPRTKSFRFPTISNCDARRQEKRRLRLVPELLHCLQNVSRTQESASENQTHFKSELSPTSQSCSPQLRVTLRELLKLSPNHSVSAQVTESHIKEFSDSMKIAFQERSAVSIESLNVAFAPTFGQMPRHSSCSPGQIRPKESVETVSERSTEFATSHQICPIDAVPQGRNDDADSLAYAPLSINPYSHKIYTDDDAECVLSAQDYNPDEDLKGFLVSSLSAYTSEPSTVNIKGKNYSRTNLAEMALINFADDFQDLDRHEFDQYLGLSYAETVNKTEPQASDCPVELKYSGRRMMKHDWKDSWTERSPLEERYAVRSLSLEHGTARSQCQGQGPDACHHMLCDKLSLELFQMPNSSLAKDEFHSSEIFDAFRSIAGSTREFLDCPPTSDIHHELSFCRLTTNAVLAGWNQEAYDTSYHRSSSCDNVQSSVVYQLNGHGEEGDQGTFLWSK